MQRPRVLWKVSKKSLSRFCAYQQVLLKQKKLVEVKLDGYRDGLGFL